jgi:hypothetical protein
MSDSGHALVYRRENPEDAVREGEPDGRISLVDADGDEVDSWPAWNRWPDGSPEPTIGIPDDSLEEITDSIRRHGIDSLTIADEEFDVSVHDSRLSIHKQVRETRSDGGRGAPKISGPESASSGIGPLAAWLSPLSPFGGSSLWGTPSIPPSSSNPSRPSKPSKSSKPSNSPAAGGGS